MKTFILCLSLFALTFSPSNAFLSGIVDSISGSVNNAVDSISNTINTALLAGEFLWDNALQPSLQVLQENGANFIDNYFGNILNAIGKRNVDALNVKSQRDFMLRQYSTQVSTFVSKLKDLFLKFLKNGKNTLVSSLPSIIAGETTVREVLVDLIKQAKAKIVQLVQQAVSNLTASSRSFGMENLASELGNIISQMGDLLLNQFNQAISSLLGQIQN
ncbi:hypothetical protein BpHYR1_004669 [Brachionus plicatilis]|uniref:Uncharacterized protein n=1 Tax=Brachionus plicatilis TaxID=10195 RepID=A0A3M7RZC6_BRAPC|nr:hypothetical protein BpHYR1_004669 [Brachionus plicatilis]